MKIYKITEGGQVAVPAEVRRRWGSSRVAFEDLGDRLVVRPVPNDPISSFRGSLAGSRGPNSDEMRREARRAEHEAEERRFGVDASRERSAYRDGS